MQMIFSREAGFLGQESESQLLKENHFLQGMGRLLSGLDNGSDEINQIAAQLYLGRLGRRQRTCRSKGTGVRTPGFVF